MQEPWQLELRQCIRTIDQLEKFIPIKDRERLEQVIHRMRLAITPHTAKYIQWDDPKDPLLLMAMPQEDELIMTHGERWDPIGDDAKSPVPFLTHRYPDRVLVYPTFFCSLSCRFCFRREKTGGAQAMPNKKNIETIHTYVLEHPSVEEVIFSGGDPLTLTDIQIQQWLDMAQAIPSIRRIRFHTRVLVNLPSRITPSLIQLLKNFQHTGRPAYIVTHFNHPKEIAQENIHAVNALADAGIIIRNQHPLLRGVNDNAKILEELYKKLADIRIVPYYIHQLDLAPGTNHFRVPIECGIEIMKQLQDRVTGIALPKYMLDLPGGKGKIPLSYQFLKKEPNKWCAETPFDEEVAYQEPPCQAD